jgi:gliding motility-associated-like protein
MMTTSIRILLFAGLVIIALCNTADAQSGTVRYGFDDCTLTDAGGVLPDASSDIMPGCECGITANALTFNGSDQYLVFPSQMSLLFDTDFTLDFYFRPDPIAREMDVLSNKSDCLTVDSSLTIRYFGDTEEILVEFGSNINNFFSIKVPLDKNLCWHRVSLVKFNLEYRLLIDNVLIRRIISRENIILKRLAPISIADNPCISTDAIPFAGSIDEFRIIPRALSDLELGRSYLFPDRIVTTDTTIFKGDAIKIIFGNTCAENIVWTPAQGLDNNLILSPVASPEETTTYTAKITSGNCIVTDELTIYIADKDKLDCNRILLPKAFTPNNDGLNDSYGISNTFIIESLEFFEIFDRWGAKMWSASGITDQWDGSFNGTPVNPGTYIYKIKYMCGDEERVSVSSFSVIR